MGFFPKFVLSALILIVLPLRADEVSLIHLGESWRYFRGTNEPSAPVTAWRQLAFDDSSWETGLSGLASTGDEGTAFPPAPSFRCFSRYSNATESRRSSPGQAFDFVGTPIPALSGNFSDLGDGWVNNDATNLYVGLSHVLLGSSDNIFLFIESPRLAGVNTIAGLGNGRADPAGEGVDGLDFLQNPRLHQFLSSDRLPAGG